MQRVRRDIYSGVVLERIIYSVGDRTQKPYRPRKPRFKTDEERARFNAEVARRAHTRIITRTSPRPRYTAHSPRTTSTKYTILRISAASASISAAGCSTPTRRQKSLSTWAEAKTPTAYMPTC